MKRIHLCTSLPLCPPPSFFIHFFQPSPERWWQTELLCVFPIQIFLCYPAETKPAVEASIFLQAQAHALFLEVLKCNAATGRRHGWRWEIVHSACFNADFKKSLLILHNIFSTHSQKIKGEVLQTMNLKMTQNSYETRSRAGTCHQMCLLKYVWCGFIVIFAPLRSLVIPNRSIQCWK